MELIEIAILAYRNARYRDAVELLLQAIDADGSSWLAKMYLGMSYERCGRSADAHRIFKRLAAECPDDHIRAKAENALPLVEAELRRRFEKAPAPGKKDSGSASTNISDEMIWTG